MSKIKYRSIKLVSGFHGDACSALESSGW